MESPDLRRVVRTIEGVVALCLGSSARVIWVDQSDAAAFSDGDKLFLPRPTGLHPQEYELLLAVALREVAKVTYTPPGSLACDIEVRPYASAIEETRIKHVFSHDYLGAPAVFARAMEVAAGLFAAAADEGLIQPAQLRHLAIWGAAHDALLATPATAGAADQLLVLATDSTERTKLEAALVAARRAPLATSTQAAVALGHDIYNLLKEDEAEPEKELDAAEGGAEGDTAETEGSSESNEAAGEQVTDESAQHGAEPEDGTAQSEVGSAGGSGNATSGADGEDNAPDSAKPSEDQNEVQADATNDVGPAGSNAESGDGTGEYPQAPSQQPEQGNATEGSASQVRSDAAPDALAHALALANGHRSAKDVSIQSEVLKAAAVQAVDGHDALSPAQVAALEAALNDPVRPAEAAMAAADTGFAVDGATERALEAADTDDVGGLGLSSACGGSNSLLAQVPSRLVSVLLHEFQDRRRRPFTRGASGWQIAVSHVWRLQRLGDPRVFKKKAPVCGVDAAVSLLLDASESMEDVGMEDAAMVTYNLALALLRIAGIQVSIDVFPGRQEHSEELLGFKQNLRKAEGRLRSVGADGGTPTGSALGKRLPLLMAARAQKKFVIVITDGKPHPSQVQMTRGLIADAQKTGITVLGVGIKTDISDLFPLSARVDSVAELPGALERLFKTEVAYRLAA
jgi:hypothetical protein